ncbi:MAG: type I-D CRISPR-associated helicase Cas3' [Anaerolineae bacterium]|nr:type I-D CRISPR-associated helicase Cas3' [Anaerolineae bacterium]
MLLDSDAILTNPDIFHLIMQARYKRPGAATDTVLGYLAHRYRLFVFDEFHLFGAPQVASVMIALLLLQEITAGLPIEHRPRALFLSATPQSLLAHLATKAGLDMVTIDREYEHGGPEPNEGSSLQRILQPVTLRLYDAKMEDWITEHLKDVILHFFREHHPSAQGVIIVNSVATAYRVYNLLEEPCRRTGIRLPQPNTGLTPRSLRTLDGDLVIATSTIDVGVDFRINLLIFESLDAATHMQRLGRLGRHVNNSKGQDFTHFEAHGLLRQWVIDGIATELPDGTTVDREKYEEVLREKYPPMQQFNDYVPRWGSVQARHILDELRHREIKTQYAAIRERLWEQFKPIFPKMGMYVSLKTDQRMTIVNEAISFRGGSPFNALVLDRTQPNSEVIPYNLITLLVNADLEEVSLDKLYDYAIQREQYLQALKRTDPLVGYYRHGWLDKPRRLGILLDGSLPPEQADMVIERTGFRIDLLDGSYIPELSKLNRILERRKVVALLLPDKRVDELRQRWRLGSQLELFPFRSSEDGIEGVAAFGRDALLLDSIVNRFPKASKHSSDNRPFML